MKGAKKGHPKWGGKKKGTKNKKTIEKEKALELYKQEHLKKLRPLITAQQELAMGEVVMLQRKLVKNQKTGKLERSGELTQVRDASEVIRLLNSDGRGEDWHLIFTKDPNAKAQEDIFNRVFGKPKEEIDISVAVKDLKAIQKGQRAIIELAKKRRRNEK
ncbi:MAG: hypothetical protein PHQ35_10690 [Phycisphaerae bacterium]|nr:hypothetical protein [Phycisphaerae bacterium]